MFSSGWVLRPNTELQIYVGFMLNLPACNGCIFEVAQVEAMTRWNVACFVSLDLLSREIMNAFVSQIVLKKLFR